MQVTEVKVYPVQEEKLKAFVSVVFDDCFMVNDIKVIRGRDGFFISMPSRRKKNGRFKDVAHPLNNDTREMIEREVLAAYEDAKAGRGGERRRNEPTANPPAREEAQERRPPESSTAKGRNDSSADQERTLEEVAEAHLRDSFWTS